jgi:hypothetical protein
VNLKNRDLVQIATVARIPAVKLVWYAFFLQEVAVVQSNLVYWIICHKLCAIWMREQKCKRPLSRCEGGSAQAVSAARIHNRYSTQRKHSVRRARKESR